MILSHEKGEKYESEKIAMNNRGPAPIRNTLELLSPRLD